MAAEKLGELRRFAPEGGPARIEIHQDGLVFNARGADGTVVSSAAVGLADLTERARQGDVLPVLAFGVFMQLNRLNATLERQAAQTHAYDPTDPDVMAAKLGPMVGVVAKLLGDHGITDGLGMSEAVERVVERTAEAAKRTPEPQPPGATREMREE